ncbi:MULTISPECIES: hypothetical protein [Bradyrhizobium]|uniref:Uncharacterized protein n=1 Tax=Bradyrhizobium diversitatis TaxID=2755406 RepID=A0ABS0P176_9BRAD|nr:MULTISPECIES: hypothetical protein [Bradyrhizobium]MBH5387008.1 hypothetical protein [Bradyrhizobium diversitatis]UPJ65466.1 hypothetical protein IVB23_37065 [Bradyrhizobium sp. 191]
MNVDASPSMAKHRVSVNRIPDRSIADIMPSDPRRIDVSDTFRLIDSPEARSMKCCMQASLAKDETPSLRHHVE